eukprot:gene20579-27376_t
MSKKERPPKDCTWPDGTVGRRRAVATPCDADGDTVPVDHAEDEGMKLEDQSGKVAGHYYRGPTGWHALFNGPDSYSPFFKAITEDNINFVEAEIAAKPGLLNATITVLYWGENDGDTSISTSCSVKSRTPLMVAAYHGALRVLALLLSKGADTTAACEMGTAEALAYSSQDNAQSKEIVLAMLKDASMNRHALDPEVSAPSSHASLVSLSEPSHHTPEVGMHAHPQPMTSFPRNWQPQGQMATPQGSSFRRVHTSKYPTSELTRPEYSNDTFRLFCYKNARRRDPRDYHYCAQACPDYKQGFCVRGDACCYAHGIYECWLHPSKYRTQLCKDGTNCDRPVCFFAHSLGELRSPSHIWEPTPDGLLAVQHPPIGPKSGESSCAHSQGGASNAHSVLGERSLLSPSTPSQQSASPRVLAERLGPVSPFSFRKEALPAEYKTPGVASGGSDITATLETPDTIPYGSSDRVPTTCCDNAEGSECYLHLAAIAVGGGGFNAGMDEHSHSLCHTPHSIQHRGSLDTLSGGDPHSRSQSRGATALGMGGGGPAAVGAGVSGAAALRNLSMPRMSNEYARRHGLNPRDNPMLNAEKLRLQQAKMAGQGMSDNSGRNSRSRSGNQPIQPDTPVMVSPRYGMAAQPQQLSQQQLAWLAQQGMPDASYQQLQAGAAMLQSQLHSDSLSSAGGLSPPTPFFPPLHDSLYQQMCAGAPPLFSPWQQQQQQPPSLGGQYRSEDPQQYRSEDPQQYSAQALSQIAQQMAHMAQLQHMSHNQIPCSMPEGINDPTGSFAALSLEF